MSKGIKDYQQKKEQLLINQGFCCAKCRIPFTPYDRIELSHVLIKGKGNLKEFGIEIIDHILNLRATHSGSCNSGVIINRSKTELVKAHVKRIKQYIKAQES